MSVSKRISWTLGGGRAIANPTIPMRGGDDFPALLNGYCGLSRHNRRTTWKIRKNKLFKKKYLTKTRWRRSWGRKKKKAGKKSTIGRRESGNKYKDRRKENGNRVAVKAPRGKTITSFVGELSPVAWERTAERSFHWSLGHLFHHACPSLMNDQPSQSSLFPSLNFC